MRGLVIFLLILAVIGSFFVAANIKNPEKIETKQEPKIFEFSTFTTAVCNNKNDVVHCKDIVYVKCNGTISELEDAAECNGLKLYIPKASGVAVFRKEWKDPRA